MQYRGTSGDMVIVAVTFYLLLNARTNEKLYKIYCVTGVYFDFDAGLCIVS